MSIKRPPAESNTRGLESLTTDHISADSEFEIRVSIASAEDIVAARQEGRAMVQNLGFSTTQATLVATVISELARNIVLYAGTGEILLSRAQNRQHVGIMVIASDEGPGITDLKHALMSGYSTSGGLGLGLPGVKQIMDSFDIKSEPGKGTVVTTVMWL